MKLGGTFWSVSAPWHWKPWIVEPSVVEHGMSAWRFWAVTWLCFEVVHITRVPRPDYIPPADRRLTGRALYGR